MSRWAAAVAHARDNWWHPTMQALGYRGYRFPTAIIQHAVWLYLRFTLSFRDVQNLLAERGITVSHETIRLWVAQVLHHDDRGVCTS